MRIWFKQWKKGKMIADTIVDDFREETRTHKIFHALEEACYMMNLGRPLWLDLTVKDFKRYGKARFTRDCFIEEIPFDYLEIEVLEED